MDKTCSFSGVGNICCGESRGENNIINLSECQADLANHLSSCHLSKSSLREDELILARAGHFNLTEDLISQMRICPNHRHKLGRYWRPLRTCQHPLHSGVNRKCEGRDVFNSQLSELVYKLHGKLVQIGSRK